MFKLTLTDTPFELRLSEVATTAIVEVIGEIDMATAPEVAEAIGSLHGGVHRRLVVNLSEVTFLDSSALNMLVRCQRDLAQREVDLHVVSPRDRAVGRVFEITRLSGPLNVVESIEEAVTPTS